MNRKRLNRPRNTLNNSDPRFPPLRGKLPKAEGGSPLSLRHQLFRGFLGIAKCGAKLRLKAAHDSASRLLDITVRQGAVR